MDTARRIPSAAGRNGTPGRDILPAASFLLRTYSGAGACPGMQGAAVRHSRQGRRHPDGETGTVCSADGPGLFQRFANACDPIGLFKARFPMEDDADGISPLAVAGEFPALLFRAHAPPAVNSRRAIPRLRHAGQVTTPAGSPAGAPLPIFPPQPATSTGCSSSSHSSTAVSGSRHWPSLCRPFNRHISRSGG